MLSGGSMIIAFDVGATAIKGLLTNLSGDNLAAAEGPGFNLRQSDSKAFSNIFNDLVKQLSSRANTSIHNPAAVAIGLAGGGGAGREKVRKPVESKWGNARILVHHDAYIAHYGAFNGDPGVIVTAGTGSIAYGRNAKGTDARSGGWGWMLGDEGSGWWIGREAIRAVLAAAEGEASTALTPIVLETFDVDAPLKLLSVVYKEDFDRKRISSLAKTVSTLAGQGDVVSVSIIRQAGIMLGETALSVARQLEIKPVELMVALLGGVGEGAGKPLQDGIDEILEAYARDNSEAGRTGEESEPGKTGSGGAEINDDRFPRIPKFPPSDLTINPAKGPLRVSPQMDPVHGAAQWARDTILKRSFA